MAGLKLQNKLRPLTGFNDRYIYYPDHLVKLPTPIPTLGNILSCLKGFLTEPLYDGLFAGGVNVFRTESQRTKTRTPPDKLRELLAEDESVGHFLERLLGDDRLVKNLVSAMMHGIYGGDVYQLSAKHTILERYWRSFRLPRLTDDRDLAYVEKKEIVLMTDMLCGPNRVEIAKMAERAVGWSVMAFEDGLISLVDGLVKDLEARNVTIKTKSRVTALAYKDDQVSVTSAAGKTGAETTKQYDQVICTLFSQHLASLVQPRALLPALAATRAVTIMVVNLWFPNAQLLARNRGFGYLVPSSTPDNDECVLGVLFDSDLETRGDERAGTKLTVMLGGHHWDGWAAHPTEAMGEAMALQAVQRHLDIGADEPVVARAQLCRDCLPQHVVGHRARMATAHWELLAAFKGRLAVAGPSYTTIGVIPAMRAGFDVAMRVARGRGPPWFWPHEEVRVQEQEQGAPDMVLHRDEIPDHVGQTGLQGFTEAEIDLHGPFERGWMYCRDWTYLSNRLTDGRGNPRGNRKREDEESEGGKDGGHGGGGDGSK